MVHKTTPTRLCTSLTGVLRGRRERPPPITMRLLTGVVLPGRRKRQPPITVRLFTALTVVVKLRRCFPALVRCSLNIHIN